MKVAVLGAGSWGTTLADLLGRKGIEVHLWAFEAEVIRSINDDHANPLYLPGARLSPALTATSDAVSAVTGAECVVLVSPSHVTRQLLATIAPVLMEGQLVVSATKGLETGTLATMSEVAAAVLPRHRFVALSGPSFAREVQAGQPTAVVAAATDPSASEAAQSLFSTAYFRVYSNRDVIGTELAGSLKNTIAIAAGILEGLGLGDNPRAALVTRGLAEMSRLGVAAGADPRTFAGLAGLGDLILTTCGNLSRNRALGLAITQGTSLAQYQREHRTVAEGVNTARAAVRLAARYGVEMPIAAKVAEVLFDEKPPRLAIAELMDRTLKPEL